MTAALIPMSTSTSSLGREKPILKNNKKGQRDKGQRDKGTKGQRDKGTKIQMDKGTKGKRD